MDLEVVISKFKVDGGDFERSSPPESLLEYGQQIENIFSEGLAAAKLDAYLGLAFPESDSEGLLAFLRKTMINKKYDKVKELVFNLIQFILQQRLWRDDVKRFCLRLKNTAHIFWFNSKVSAKIQQAALDCLIALYENFGGLIDLTDFEIAQLYWELLPRSEKTSFQPTVRGKMFNLLGLLAALGHQTFMKIDKGRFKQIFGHLTNTVKGQVNSADAKVEVSILLGCIKGMNQLLNVFREEINSEEDKAWLEFQDHLEQILDPNISIVKTQGKAKIKRREFQRAGLQLVADHGDLLKIGLFAKHRQWFGDLLEWCKSSNADDNRIGRRAMHKFLDTVVGHAKNLKEAAGDGEEDVLMVPVEVLNFLRFFSEKFKSILMTKDANRIELAIAVRGYGMLSGLSDDDNQPTEMLKLLMQHVTTINQELDSQNLDPYSATLSIITTYLESVATILPSIKGEISEEHLDSIKQLTILLIRFYPQFSEGQRSFCHISVQKIIDSLWTNHHNLCEPFVEQVYRQSMLHIVSCPTRAEIDILVEAFNKANPNSKKSPYKQLGLRPATFYVRFWRLLLSRGGPSADADLLRFNLLMKWILNTIEKLDLSVNFEEDIDSSDALDPVLGATPTKIKDFQIFVNIVDFFQELMKGEEFEIHKKFESWTDIFATEILAYIQSHGFVSGFYKILAVVFDSARKVKYFESQSEERRRLKDKLNLFFKRLGTKIQEFRDDLLFAVLELWLSLPDELILSNFKALDSTLVTVFTTGRNSFNLAVKGLEAVERWFFQEAFPVDEIKAIMNNIFPILKTYFNHSEDVEEDQEEKKIKKGKGNMKEMLKKNKQQRQRGEEEETLKTTQLKILKLIGYFGEFIELEERGHQGLSKDEKFLKYAVPFQDCKPDLLIDDMLPRVLELCENAVERQTRMSACEYFHTIALLFLGQARVASEFQERLFKRIFQSMLKLGCDSDVAVRQLFNPLCLQTIHWYTKSDSPYGGLVLNILTENLTQHQDLSLRELAALCIGEYFNWSLKQSVYDSSERKAKDVLKTIFALSTHSSIDYRQGSVLAFNSIYREFRAKKNLVNEFSFNLLYSFLTSLKLSKDMAEDSLLVTSTKQSVKHLQRILVEKKDRFNTKIENPKRQFKPMSGSGTDPILSDVVEWLLIQGGSTAGIYREECLRLVRVLAPCVKDFGSVERCLTSWEDGNGFEDWIKIAEQSNPAKKLRFLDASSQFYNFLFEFNMLNKRVFCGEGSKSKFVKNLFQVCKQFGKGNEFEEEEKIRFLQIMSRLGFIWEIFERDALQLVWTCSMELSRKMGSFYSSSLMEELVKVWRLGRDELKPVMGEKCGGLLRLEPIKDLAKKGEEMSLASSVSDSDWFRVVAEGGIMEELVDGKEIEGVREKLWASVNNSLFKSGGAVESNYLGVNERKIVENYLITAIHLGLDKEIVVDSVFDSSQASRKDGTYQVVTTKGAIFQKELMKALVYCDKLFDFDKLLKERPIKDVGEFIQKLLELLRSDKGLRMRFGGVVFNKTVEHWRMISVNCEMVTSVKIFVGLVGLDGDKCRNCQGLAEWWNGTSLMKARHLDLKQKTGVVGYASVFAKGRNKKGVEAVIQTISSFIENEVNPQQMSWSDMEQYVIHILRKALIFFEELPYPLNLQVLQAILSLMQKASIWIGDEGKNHVIYSLVRDSLERMVHSCGVDNERVSLASKLYELITSERNKLFVEAEVVWKWTLIPVISSLNREATKKFFKENIYAIISSVEGQPKNIYDWLRKTLSVNLLELMVYQTGADFIKSMELTGVYMAKVPEDKKKGIKIVDDKTVYRSMLKICVDVWKQLDGEGEKLLKNSWVKCAEACYNTLAVMLIETKAEYKFCTGFLFPEKKGKKWIFEYFVDREENYEFPVVIEDDDKSKLRRKVFYKRKVKKGGGGEFSIGGQSAFLPVSGSLAGSSLEPEATSYDFTTQVTVANSEFYQRIFASQQEGGGAGEEIGGGDEKGKLEWNEVNEHSCMAAYVEVLKYMGRLNKESKGVGTKDWIGKLVKTLGDQTVHNNVKIFIVGGINNEAEVMEQFGKELVEPIVKLIVGNCLGGTGMNHFVQDTILTLLSWSGEGGDGGGTVKPGAEMVKKIISYVVQSLTEEITKRRDVFSHVLEILKNIVKLWVGSLDEIPMEEIAGLCPNNGLAEEGAGVFLNVCLSVLMGGRLPHKDTGELLKKFLKAAGSKLKGIYTVAGKCLGILLSISSREAPEEVRGRIEQAVVDKVISGGRSKPTVFIDLVSAIEGNYAGFVLLVKATILELCQYPKVRGELLKLLPLLFKEELTRAEKEDDGGLLALSPNRSCGDAFYRDVIGRRFFAFDNPCKGEDELKAGLELLELLVDNCSPRTDLLVIVDWLRNSAEGQGSGSELKVEFATVLVKLYERLWKDSIEDSSRLDMETKKRFFKIFIRLYEDEGDKLHEVVSGFWDRVLIEWTKTGELLLELFRLVGDEERPLNICLGIMLQRCSLAPDYSKMYFKEPLEKCDFHPFQLDTSWRLKNSSFQPLFAESLSSGFGTLPRTIQSTLLSQRRSVGRFGMNVLKATLATMERSEFTRTQNEEGVERGVFGGEVMEVDSYTMNFQPNLSYFPSTSNIPGNQEQSWGGRGSGSGASQSQSPILKMRRKFYSRKGSEFYAQKESEKQVEKREEAKEERLQKQGGVKTVRNYRIGDFPDVMISNEDILKTLGKLAKLDERVGKDFVGSLFKGMVDDMDGRDRTGVEKRRFLRSSGGVFDKVLRNSNDKVLNSLIVELSAGNGIRLPLNRMLEVCKATHNQKVGVLKVEKDLLEGENSEGGNAKRVKLAVPDKEEDVGMWLGLAEMLKEIEEYDGLKNIFKRVEECKGVGEKKEFYGMVGEALHLEGRGMLAGALEKFDRALDIVMEEDGEDTTKLFLEDCMMHCLTKLGDWDTLLKSTFNFNSSLADDILQDQNVVDRLIPYKMLAGIHLTLRGDIELDEGSDDPQKKVFLDKFTNFVVSLLETEDGTSFMFARYPFEIGAWYLVENEDEYLPFANLMVDRGYEEGINWFRNMDGYSLKSQRKAVMCLEQANVISDYLKWKKPHDSFRVIEERTKMLLSSWRKHLGYFPNDLIGGDYVSANRDCFSAKIGLRIGELGGDEELLKAVQEGRVEQDIWLANLGIIHKNFSIAEGALRRLEMRGLESLKEVEFRKTRARFLAQLGGYLERSDWCKMWRNAWKKLGRIGEESEQESLRGIKADLLLCALEAGREGEEGVAPIVKVLGGNAGEQLTPLVLKSTEELMQSTEGLAGPLYSKLFHLLKKLSNNFEDAEEKSSEKIMECLIKGCGEGGGTEMLLLANVFSLLKKFPGLNGMFEEMSASLPTYLFLPWIDQLMTIHKSSPEGYTSFKKIIGRLVKEYPQAFQIQYPEYLSSSQKLFAKALKAVVLPYKMHEAQVHKIYACKKDEDLISRLLDFQEALQEIINNEKIFGEYHKEFATQMFELVNNTVNEQQRSSASSNGSDEGKYQLNQVKGRIQEIMEVQIKKAKKVTRLQLAKLSPFLAEFHFFEHENVQRPGLYEDFRKPIVEDHPLIVSFHQIVTCYDSLTKPLKLTAITNDGKKSNFLAKLGDDLRQDRRIQQLFKVSNELLLKDRSKKNVGLTTYSCIPITSDFGIIEMVDNSMSLADVLFDTQQLAEIRNKTMQTYDGWILQTSGKTRSQSSHYSYYTDSARLATRMNCDKIYSLVTSQLPKFLLRDNIEKRSGNLNEFFSIRQTAIKSYGVVCMVHWLLGIGDRHLDNCLVSMDSGKFVGIDFGRAFGTSNYVIPVPELVPFRLTYQLQNLMLPYTFKGLFRESCIQTWNCLVEAGEFILTIADVFIQEPSINWLELRETSKSGQKREEGDQGQEQVADFPFEIMKRKLINWNPVEIVKDELGMHRRKDVKEIYSKIAEDGREAYKEKERLSREEYVDVLLELATDKNVLMRVYHGWNSWV